MQSIYNSGRVPLQTPQSCQGRLHTEVSGPQQLEAEEDARKWQCCECIPICLPLIALISISGATFDDRLLTALIDWARTMSWGSFCSDHLMRLAQFIPGEYPPGKERSEVIQKLEEFCLRECYRSIGKGQLSCIGHPQKLL